MENYVPIFEIIIDENNEESGMIRNSGVENPAVDIEYFAFGKENENMIFSKDEKEQVFTSVSILADTPILRKGPNGEPFYVVFSKDVIRKIRNKLVKDGKTNEFSLYHDEKEIQEGIYMVESYIVDSKRVESKLFDVPDGSFVTSYWVEDKEMYEKLLADEKFKGFSIELNSQIQQMFSQSFEDMYSEEKKVDRIKDIAFSEDLSDKEKEEKIKKLLNSF